MHRINTRKCKRCGICVKNCPLGAITYAAKKKHPQIEEALCVDCNVCTRVCPSDAVDRIPLDRKKDVGCDHCVINCRVSPGKTGACQRYVNVKGQLIRRRPILIPNPVDFKEMRRTLALSRPSKELRAF